nr:hypothetical protein [uncultured Nitrososphaera sp.]
MNRNKLFVYYCKCLKETGRPIIISNGKSEINTDNVIFSGIDGRISFQNTTGKAKSRGATSCLQIDLT